MPQDPSFTTASKIFGWVIGLYHPEASHLLSQTLCQMEFSLYYLLGSMCVDGEGIKCMHSNTGPVCNGTKQMGPGSHHDTMDCYWVHWNWQKCVGLGKSLLVAHDHEAHLQPLDRSFSLEDAHEGKIRDAPTHCAVQAVFNSTG